MQIDHQRVWAYIYAEKKKDHCAHVCAWMFHWNAVKERRKKRKLKKFDTDNAYKYFSKF